MKKFTKQQKMSQSLVRMILLFSVLNGPNIPSLKEKKKDIGSIKSSDCVERKESSTSLSKSCGISNFIFIFTVMAKNIGTLDNWIIGGCENLSFHYIIRILNGGKYHYELNVFSQIHVEKVCKPSVQRPSVFNSLFFLLCNIYIFLPLSHLHGFTPT